MAQKPVAIGMLLCDQVIVEEGTRNVTLVNCFTQKPVRRLPSDPFSFIVFSILTDGLGEFQLSVVIQRLDDLEEVYVRSIVVRFTSPLQEARCMLQCSDCSLPVFGGYQVTLLADDEPLARRKLYIISAEEAHE